MAGFTLLIWLAGWTAVFCRPDPPGENWSGWRGRDNCAYAEMGNPPLNWDENSNILWKTQIPGRGNATPVVWGDQVILLTAVETGEKDPDARPAGSSPHADWMKPRSTAYIHEYAVVSVDRNSGGIRWSKTVRRQLPHSSTHDLGSWASNSPVTDGKHIYAYFGSMGLYCLDMDGGLVWERDFGLMEKHMNFGEGSSPALWKDRIFIQRDHNGLSELIALEKESGKEIWRIERDEGTSWATPLVVSSGERTQVVTSASNKVRSYDAVTGELVWECSGMSKNVIPSPMYSDGLVYLMSGYGKFILMAVDLSKAEGDIDGTEAVVWTYEKNTSYTPSAVLARGKIYFMKSNNPFLTCLDAVTGEEYYSVKKLEGIKDLYSSPVGVGDRLIVPSSNGAFVTVELGEEFRVLAVNRLDEGSHSSPVISGDAIIYRGSESLYCIGHRVKDRP